MRQRLSLLAEYPVQADAHAREVAAELWVVHQAVRGLGMRFKAFQPMPMQRFHSGAEPGRLCGG